MAPIKIVSEANRSRHEHWGDKTRRRKNQQAEIDAVMFNAMHGQTVALPCVVRLTRIGPKALDTDNLAGAFKGCRDAIAKRLGVDDGDTDKVTWEYKQMPVGIRDYGVKVSITSNGG